MLLAAAPERQVPRWARLPVLAAESLEQRKATPLLRNRLALLRAALPLRQGHRERKPLHRTAHRNRRLTTIHQSFNFNLPTERCREERHLFFWLSIVQKDIK